MIELVQGKKVLSLNSTLSLSLREQQMLGMKSLCFKLNSNEAKQLAFELLQMAGADIRDIVPCMCCQRARSQHDEEGRCDTFRANLKYTPAFKILQDVGNLVSTLNGIEVGIATIKEILKK